MGSMSARFRHSVLVMFSVLAFTAPATAAADAGSAGRAQAASERCTNADALPSQAAGRRPACRHAVPDERRARGAAGSGACRPSRS